MWHYTGNHKTKVRHITAVLVQASWSGGDIQAFSSYFQDQRCKTIHLEGHSHDLCSLERADLLVPHPFSTACRV